MLVEKWRLHLGMVGGKALEQVHAKLAHGTLASREASEDIAQDLRSSLMTDSLVIVSKAPV